MEEGQKNRLLIPSPVVWALGFLLTVVYFSVSWHVLFHKELFLLDRFFPGHLTTLIPLRQSKKEQNASFLVQETNLDIY